jgi:DNA invertase Pin-like site-specific DNA recombinase
MPVIGYARVSTTDQNLELQENALRAAGCEIIRLEKRSDTTTAWRDELRTVLDFLRKGDVLMVTRIDRLARSIGDLQDIVRTVKTRGASLKATEQPIDTSTAAGKCFLDMLGVFAEFETNLRRERQLEGIADAKARGVYRGTQGEHWSYQNQADEGWRRGTLRNCQGSQDRSGIRVSGAIRIRWVGIFATPPKHSSADPPGEGKSWPRSMLLRDVQTAAAQSSIISPIVQSAIEAQPDPRMVLGRNPAFKPTATFAEPKSASTV